jgi:hypothetical protein
MPGLQFNTLPADINDNPFSILDVQLKRLNETTKIRENELRTRRLTPQDYTNEVYSLQDNYAKQVGQLKQLRNNMQQVQLLVNAKHISPEEGKKAMWRMVLPPETERAMFPTVSAEKPAITPTEAATGFVSKIAEGYITKTKGWGKKEIEDLLPRYKEFRNEMAVYFNKNNYEELLPEDRKKIDMTWDMKTRELGETEWDPQDFRIQGLRPTGTLERAARKLVSPIAASIQEERRKKSMGLRFPLQEILTTAPWKLGKQEVSTEPKTLDETTARRILQEVGGDKNKARELARQRGYQI